MIYQCTQEMLKILKVDPVLKPDIFNALYAWHVKSIKVGRKNLTYLMNDASKLSVIYYGLTAKEYKHFDELVQDGIRKILEDLGVAGSIIEQYFSYVGQPIFTSTGTRKQIAGLNRAAMEVDPYHCEIPEEDLLKRVLSNHQNKAIIKNDKGVYIRPKVVMKNMLEKNFGNLRKQFDLVEISSHMFHDDFEVMSFLNMRDGKIHVEKRASEESQILLEDDDYVLLYGGSFDFYSNFMRFSDTLDHVPFVNDLKALGHGKGAVNNIRQLLVMYPEIQKKWLQYKSSTQLEMAKIELECLGLL